MFNEFDGLTPDQNIRDPSDGNPGFTFSVTKCDARGRVIGLMIHSADKNRSLYCDVAISASEDLEVCQLNGDHFDKSQVGDLLFQ